MTSRIRRTFSRLFVASSLGLFSLGGRAAAQQRSTLTGRVLDGAQQPVRGVRVSSTIDSVLAVTDERGRFTLRGLTPGMTKFLIRRIGYEPGEFSLPLIAAETLVVDLRLEQAAVPIAGTLTVGQSQRQRVLATFERHRYGSNGGHFITREDIERRNPRTLSDIVRTIAGVELVPGGPGTEPKVRMARANAVVDCPIQYWVDGIRATNLELDDISPGDVEALEIYTGPSTLPPEYNGRWTNAACGTIVIWTRVPGQ